MFLQVPVFVRQTAIALTELHVYFMFELGRELIKLIGEMYDPKDKPVRVALSLWVSVSEQLEGAGHLVREP